MRVKQFISYWLFFGIGLAAVTQGAAEQTSTGAIVPRAGKHYDVAAFVWPSYHPDDRAKIFWPMGMGEWETVMHDGPMAGGHEQPGHPLWGYVNEADPYVMEMQIEAASDYGINVFIYDWYWYDRMPFLEGCLNNGYLKAKNNNKVKFYIMWANHDVTLVWDKRNADDAFGKKNTALVWRGGIDRVEFEKIAQRWITKYFSQPSYYKINDKPVIMIYDINTFINGLGGTTQAREALDWFRAETIKAGFKGLELQLSMRRESTRSLTGVAGEPIGTQSELVTKLGFDSLTHYQFVHFLDINRNYAEIVKDAAIEWKRINESYAARYYPHVSVGWDSSPRAFNAQPGIVKNNRPEEFEKALILAREFVDSHPDRAPLITINSWNEWTETSYLEPSDRFGYGYLEAVKRVFRQ